MTIEISREASSFNIGDSHSDVAVDAALAMAEMNRRWGHSGSIEQLTLYLRKLITEASEDSRATSLELDALKQNSMKVLILEQIAMSFKETEEDGFTPRFESIPEAIMALRDYAQTLGCAVRFRE